MLRAQWREMRGREGVFTQALMAGLRCHSAMTNNSFKVQDSPLVLQYGLLYPELESGAREEASSH